ncbi:DUF551 domain-containing protein [Sodalis sp. (in: enterobacteria)]|uniref:DUF551 domain-containing protein n=1 Tax=Sodalis sp. (in: enterobacteria) TaxID=1898979 RepID=UPI003F356DE9
MAELEQRWKTGGCGMSNSPELLQSIQKMHESYLLADYACQVYTIPQEDAELLARFALDLMERDKDQGNSVCSTTWINVSDSLPELDTPVLGCWFSYNGNFVLGCYVRTHSADAGGWVWATAEDFGKGDWLFGEDNPVEFWMPLPGKPELAGGAA